MKRFQFKSSRRGNRVKSGSRSNKIVSRRARVIKVVCIIFKFIISKEWLILSSKHVIKIIIKCRIFCPVKIGKLDIIKLEGCLCKLNIFNSKVMLRKNSLIKPFLQLIRTLATAKKWSKITGTWIAVLASFSISIMKKSTGQINSPTLISTFSLTPGWLSQSIS